MEKLDKNKIIKKGFLTENKQDKISINLLRKVFLKGETDIFIDALHFNDQLAVLSPDIRSICGVVLPLAISPARARVRPIVSAFDLPPACIAGRVVVKRVKVVRPDL